MLAAANIAASCRARSNKASDFGSANGSLLKVWCAVGSDKVVSAHLDVCLSCWVEGLATVLLGCCDQQIICYDDMLRMTHML